MTFEELINWINNRQTEWTDGFSPIDEVIKMHTHISSLEAENKDLRGRAEKADEALVKSFQDGYDAGYKYAKSGAGGRGGGGLKGRGA